MLLITAQKRLANKRIQVQKDEAKHSDDYSFDKGTLVFCFANLKNEDTVIHFHAWDVNTQETFYFANFKNMMIYYDGIQVEKIEKVQAALPKAKTEATRKETIHNSVIVDGKQIKSTHAEIYRFDNAAAFKEHLENSDEQSCTNFLLFAEEHGLNFFIPMWHCKDGLKLWVDYDHKEDCYTVSTIKQEITEVKPEIKFRKRKFEYKGVELRIGEIEEPYLNTTLINTRCIAPNNEPFGPIKGRNQTLKSFIIEVKEFLSKAEQKGIDIVQRLTKDTETT
jgi:hypothetical protein